MPQDWTKDAVSEQSCPKCGCRHDGGIGPRQPIYRFVEQECGTWEWIDWPCRACGHALTSECLDAKNV